MATPRKKKGIVKFFRLTIQYGGDEYTVSPLAPDPDIARKAFRLCKRTGDRNTYDILVTADGVECDCTGFYYRKRCKHCDMLRAARMLD
jgi:hypothetical protein